MDEETVETGAPTVGERLRAARKKKKLSLEDIAAATRVPQRHLESLEKGDWASLPAATYSVGFAKSYAGAVDLDRAEIGDQLRAEMGGQRPLAAATPEVFEPADPARTMPKWLVLGAIAAVALVVGVMSWLNNRALEGDQPEANVAAATAPAVSAPAPAPAAAPQGPVVLSASEPLWMAVYDQAGTSYFSGLLNPGTNFTVPQAATAPLLRTAKPEALTIMVGTARAPAVGAPGQKVSDVSLLPADLLRQGSGPAAAGPDTPAASPTSAPAAQESRQRPRPVRPATRPVSASPPAPPPAPAEPAPPSGNSDG